MNPYRSSLYNILDKERDDLIKRVGSDVYQAKEDALDTIGMMTIWMYQLSGQFKMGIKDEE